jgi:hypothetical protein
MSKYHDLRFSSRKTVFFIVLNMYQSNGVIFNALNTLHDVHSEQFLYGLVVSGYTYLRLGLE